MSLATTPRSGGGAASVAPSPHRLAMSRNKRKGIEAMSKREDEDDEEDHDRRTRTRSNSHSPIRGDRDRTSIDSDSSLHQPSQITSNTHEEMYLATERSHANPIWSVPYSQSSLIDELNDEDGDELIRETMLSHHSRITNDLSISLQVRMSSLGGKYHTTEPRREYLRAIVNGGVSEGSKRYDPLNDREIGVNGVVQRPVMRLTSPQSGKRKVSTQRKGNATATPTSSTSSRATSAPSIRPSNPPTTFGQEFEPIPPVPLPAATTSISDRQLLSQVFDNTPYQSRPTTQQSPRPSTTSTTNNVSWALKTTSKKEEEEEKQSHQSNTTTPRPKTADAASALHHLTLPVSGSATARSANSPRSPRTNKIPGSPSSASARSPRPKSSGFISARHLPPSTPFIPTGTTSFGYTDREACQLVSPETFLNGTSSTQPLDIISRPASSRIGTSGSLPHTTCFVKYRTTGLTTKHDPLKARLASGVERGTHAVLDLKLFRQEVEVLIESERDKEKTLSTLHTTLDEDTTCSVKDRERMQEIRRIQAERKKQKMLEERSKNGSSNASDGKNTMMSKDRTNSGLTHRLYSDNTTTASLTDSTSIIPARYTKLHGTNVSDVLHTTSFGEPTLSPFREIHSALGPQLGGISGGGKTIITSLSLAQSTDKYRGPGQYHTDHVASSSNAKHIPSITLAPNSNTNNLPLYQQQPEKQGPTLSSSIGITLLNSFLPKPKGYVSLGKTTARGEMDFIAGSMNKEALNTPAATRYDTMKYDAVAWNTRLIGGQSGIGGASAHVEHGFGTSRRWDAHGSMYKQPTSGTSSSGESYLAKNPAKRLELATPSDGPGALHTIIPSRTGIHSRYDPNIQSFLSNHGIPNLESVEQYLTKSEKEGKYGSDGSGNNGNGGDYDGRGQNDSSLHANAILTRAQEKQQKEFESFLENAMGSTTNNASPTHAATAAAAAAEKESKAKEAEVKQVIDNPPVSSDFDSTSSYSADDGILSSSIPTTHELHLRSSLFASSLTHTVQDSLSLTEQTHFQRKLLAKRVRQAIAENDPKVKEEKLSVKRAEHAARQLAVREKGHRILDTKTRRWKEKIAAENEDRSGAGDAIAMMSAGGGGSDSTTAADTLSSTNQTTTVKSGTRAFVSRWLVLVSLSSRAVFLRRFLLFKQRMSSDGHRRHEAARAIGIAWRKYQVRKRDKRRSHAIETLTRVFSTFRIRIRIRRKRRAANLLKMFFRTIIANNFQPPPAPARTASVVTSPKAVGGGSAAAAAGATSTDAQHLIDLRRKARERAALYTRAHLRANGERTLAGLIRHFKSQVLIIQRAWRSYCLMREYMIDMHVLIWDAIVSEHTPMSSYSRYGGVGGSMSHRPTTSQAKADAAVPQPQTKKSPRRPSISRRPSVSGAADSSTSTPSKPLKSIALKLDTRFTTIEKRAILLEALKQRKLRFLRVRHHWLHQQQKFVSDQSHGVSAARRLLEDEESRFSVSYYARRFSRTHAPPYLPRMMTHRQMIQVMNIAQQARKESRKTRYTSLLSSTLASPTRTPPNEPIVTSNGKSVRALFNNSKTSSTAMINGATGSITPSMPRTSSMASGFILPSYEFDLTEQRVRESLLKRWAATLVIPTRQVQLTKEEKEEDAMYEKAKQHGTHVTASHAVSAVNVSHAAAGVSSPTPPSLSRAHSRAPSISRAHSRNTSIVPLSIRPSVSRTHSRTNTTHNIEFSRLHSMSPEASPRGLDGLSEEDSDEGS